MMISDGAGVKLFHMAQIKYAMKMEMLGMRHSSGKSAFTLAKQILGEKGSREKIYKMFCAYYDELRKSSPQEE